MNMRLFFLLLPFLVLLSCSKDEGGAVDSGKIKTGPKKEVYRTTVPAAGGQVVVPGTGSPIDELTIDIPENSYPSSKEFVISYQEILSHEFGEKFHPVTPLIEVENGGDYANEVMYLGVKTTALPGQKLAPFYYDRETGKLESIPILAAFDGVIAIAVRHFSLIVVGAFEKEVIKLGGSYTTYFDPGVNGWSFANEGTWPEFGNCAGMSIGAAYYYQNRKASLLLNQHFDNSGYWFTTPDRPEDDATGLRYVSALQRLFDKTWMGEDRTHINDIFAGSDEDNFWSMIYGLFFLQDPQLVYVGPLDTGIAHMIISTGYEFTGDQATITVYDPNYPGNLNSIKFNLSTREFLPYTSAGNAIALRNGNTYNFEVIKHIPLSTVVSTRQIDLLFQKTADNSIGLDFFPKYEVYANDVDGKYPQVKMVDVLMGSKNIIPFDEFYISVKGEGPDALIEFKDVLYHLDPASQQWNVYDPSGVLELSQGKEHLIGVHIFGAKPNNSRVWIGFHYYKIEVQPIWLEASTTEAGIGEDISFTVKSNGKIPDGSRFEWNFGNGIKKNILNDSTANYGFPAAGQFVVSVRVFDVLNNKEFGKAAIAIQVSEKKFDRITISFSGLVSGDKPFIFDDGHREGTISYSNVPAFYNHPKLRWTGNRFEAEFDYGDTNTFYKQTITGELAGDLKSITKLHAEYYVEDDYGIYQSSSSFSSLSIVESTPDRIIADAKGQATQGYTESVQSSYKEKLPNGTVRTKYSLQSVEWAKARIYVVFDPE